MGLFSLDNINRMRRRSIYELQVDGEPAGEDDDFDLEDENEEEDNIPEGDLPDETNTGGADDVAEEEETDDFTLDDDDAGSMDDTTTDEDAATEDDTGEDEEDDFNLEDEDEVETGDDTPTTDDGDDTPADNNTEGDAEPTEGEDDAADPATDDGGDEGADDFNIGGGGEADAGGDAGGEGGEEGEDDSSGGDSSDAGGGDNTEGNPTDNIDDDEKRASEEEIYNSLTDDQKRIRILQLKINYKDLYETLTNSIEGVSQIPKNSDNLETIKRLNILLTKAKTILISYINNNFDRCTYLENYTTYLKYIAIFRTVSKVIEEMNNSTNKSNNG